MHKLSGGVLLSMISPMLFATVGGEETIELLGYDQFDQKIYLARYFHDASGRVPQLYYYQLNSKQPTQLIEVKSIYHHLDRHSLDAEEKVEQAFKNIQSRLMPLQKSVMTNTQIKIIKQQQSKGLYWQTSHPDDQFQVQPFRQDYLLCNRHMQSPVQHSVSYNNQALTLKHLWQVPQQNIQLAIIEYTGINVETGYIKQDPVLLSYTQKTIC